MITVKSTTDATRAVAPATTDATRTALVTCNYCVVIEHVGATFYMVEVRQVLASKAATLKGRACAIG